MPDDKPPTEEHAEQPAPPEPEHTPPPEPPDPEHVAHEEHEKVPAWGEALMAKVDALADLFPDPVKDETPNREPWHKKNPLK